jgi:hypothetical protein
MLKLEMTSTLPSSILLKVSNQFTPTVDQSQRHHHQSPQSQSLLPRQLVEKVALLVKLVWPALKVLLELMANPLDHQQNQNHQVHSSCQDIYHQTLLKFHSSKTGHQNHYQQIVNHGILQRKLCQQVLQHRPKAPQPQKAKPLPQKPQPQTHQPLKPQPQKLQPLTLQPQRPQPRTHQPLKPQPLKPHLKHQLHKPITILIITHSLYPKTLSLYALKLFWLPIIFTNSIRKRQ